MNQDKKTNKYESPLMETVEIKMEGVICTSPGPVSSCSCNVLSNDGGIGGCSETGR